MIHHGEKINVLHVVSSLPVGGVEKTVYEEIRRYDKKRFKGRVCCIMDGGEIADLLRSEGVPVDILHRMRGHGFDCGALSSLYRLIRRENIHVLRTHQYHPGIYGRIAGFLARVPVIIPTFHNAYVSPGKPKLHRCIFNNVLSHVSDVLVPVSEYVAGELIKYDRINPRKIRVIHNGIKTARFTVDISIPETRKAFSLPEDYTIIGCVGRLSDEKGHRSLIEAVSGIKGVCVAFAGEGPLIDELRKVAASCNVHSVFVGRLDPERVPSFLKSLDIYCSPSLWEGFGIALVEAMAAGLPVIASDLPSHNEVIGDAGILFSPGSSESLKNAVNKLLNDSSLKSTLSRRSVERAGLFSLDKTIQSYQELIEEIVKRKLTHETI